MKQYNYEKRESEKTKEIVEEYSKKGFKVILNPSIEELPEELKNLNFRPDIIAMSNDINLIIEIKTANSIKNDERLLAMVDKIRNIENWEFEFIYTNPKKNISSINAKNSFTYEEAQNSIERVKKFITIENNSEFTDVGLMLAWNAIVTILRINLQEDEKNNIQTTDRALIRDSVMLGILNREEQKYLEELLSKRNIIAHAGTHVTISTKDLKSLIVFAEKLLKQNV
ncbi:hypothetical protein [Sulfurimonas hydrogeniphila]|uniref:hypothetical protein n=1 Tax=Sulfurimonas hydrogeniphila TaxID=2509341 RepID=UPI00125EBB57|nr:hypothetical protein [Sulfurimonas hydrogeniphila]